MSTGDPVWILNYHHRHGVDTSVHSSKQAAREALAGICRGWWDEAVEMHANRSLGGSFPEEPPAGIDETIERYFEVMAEDDEWFEIEADSIK